MLKRFDWAPRCGVLALLFILSPPPDLGAQPNALPGQSAAQEKVAPPQAAAAPSDSITVPDGTPLTLQLVSELSSATAKLGDTVQFTTPYPLRINGMVVVPKGTALSCTVVQVSRPHRPSKNGQVSVSVEKLVLPNGEIVALRLVKSASGKPGSMAMQQKSDGLGLLWLAAPIDPAAWIGIAISPFVKGHEQVYPAGTRSLVYFNGPVNLDRAALLKLQPPPYKGPAQVFFNDLNAFADPAPYMVTEVLFTDFSAPAIRFCGQVRAGDLSVPLRLKLNPGTYSFIVDLTGRVIRGKAQPVQLEVHEDHQYWIQRERGKLFVNDVQQHQTEFEIVQSALRMIDKDFTSLPPKDSCPQVARPAP